jgi:hypothetical protein
MNVEKAVFTNGIFFPAMQNKTGDIQSTISQLPVNVSNE